VTSAVAPTIPQGLEDEIRAGNVVLFVGSGTSLGAGAPNWRQLMLELAEEARREGIELTGSDDLDDLINGSPPDMMLAAGYLRHRLGGRFGDYVRRRFGALEPQPVHRAIARLNLAGIVTTNYDCLLERVLPGWTAFVPPQPMQTREREFIFKPHGSCDRDPMAVVIDPDDYRAVLNDRAVIKLMEHLYQRYTFLFVGFGMRDPDTIATLEPLKEVFGDAAANRHYALLHRSEAGPIRREDLRERMGVHVIAYDDHDEVPAFLEALARLGKRDVTKSLLLVGGCARDARSTRLLVKESTEEWALDDGSRPWFCPNRPHTTDLDVLRRGAGRQLGIAEEDLELEIRGDLFETSTRNPLLGDRSGTYRFQLVVVRITRPPGDPQAHFERVADRPTAWMTLSELRGHRATSLRNGDVLRRLSDEFGSDLEDLPVSVQWD
jgi:hypothetical protein